MYYFYLVFFMNIRRNMCKDSFKIINKIDDLYRSSFIVLKINFFFYLRDNVIYW